MKRMVTHLIVGLGKGGAETMLYQVLKFRTDSALSYRVISLGASHYYEGPMRKLGYEVIELDIRHRPIWTLWKLCRLLRGTDTLCCWMYHANAVGYLVSRIHKVPRIVWYICHANLDPSVNKSLSLKINRLCANWSGNIDCIAYNGEQAKMIHESMGYADEKSCILDTACDMEEFSPYCNARDCLVQELGLTGQETVVLSLTKNTPIKDIPTFLRAFTIVKKKKSGCVAVLCGMNVTPENQRLAALCQELGLREGKDVFLLGMRHDVPRLLSACDLHILHSAGEAFPNVLVQAMACECLSITTDVGDAARILGDQRFVVTPGNPEMLGETMLWAMSLPKEEQYQIRKKNRIRVMNRFDIRKIVRQYEDIYLYPHGN